MDRMVRLYNYARFMRGDIETRPLFALLPIAGGQPGSGARYVAPPAKL